MRRLGAVRFPDNVFNVADHTLAFPISTAGNGMDLPSGTNWIRVTALTTGASPAPNYPFLGLGTTAVAFPTSGQSSGSSAYTRVNNDAVYPTGGSTELSLICQDSSGWASIECWK